MKRLTTWGVGPVLALTLVAASGTVSAQQVGALHVQPSTGGYSSQGGQYDYARVVRVDPVIDSGRYGSNDYASGDRRCYQRQDHARGSVYDGGYSDGYGRDDYYRGNDGYDRYAQAGNIRTGSGVTEYDVTYEYAGREYTTRTQYHPGDRIRVRVDVRPE